MIFLCKQFFVCRKNNIFPLEAENHIKLAWEMRVLNKESELGVGSKILSDNKPTWGEFVGYIKEAYLLQDIYEHKYIE